MPFQKGNQYGKIRQGVSKSTDKPTKPIEIKKKQTKTSEQISIKESTPSQDQHTIPEKKLSDEATISVKSNVVKSKVKTESTPKQCSIQKVLPEKDIYTWLKVAKSELDIRNSLNAWTKAGQNSKILFNNILDSGYDLKETVSLSNAEILFIFKLKK